MIVSYYFIFHSDQVATRSDTEGICSESRVFFIDTARRVGRQLAESPYPSVNFRGLMDPVCYINTPKIFRMY